MGAGGDFCWGKKTAWLKCIDAAAAGDITKTGEFWSYPLKQHCVATPAIASGLVYITDCGRTLHCVDAETGKHEGVYRRVLAQPWRGHGARAGIANTCVIAFRRIASEAGATSVAVGS